MDRAPDLDTVRAVFARASRAPSLHNAQPWRWRWDGAEAELTMVQSRSMPETDMLNNESVIGCGVMLHHARVAWAAAGWDTAEARFPEPTRRAHLATVRPRHPHPPTEPEHLLGSAIDRRFSDRLPMDPPHEWPVVVEILRHLARDTRTTVTVLDEARRSELGRISAVATGFRRYDPGYQRELNWWTAVPDEGGAGVPPSALPEPADRAAVPVGREFPPGTAGSAAAGADDAVVIALSTLDDTAASLLDCGSVLSAVLLECTSRTLSTCPVTHVTELPSTRAMLSRLVEQRYPQALVRIGTARHDPPPRTPRLPLDAVLTIEPGASAPPTAPG
ncbi:Acg family FMN-binding oxidoreductase [Nocardia thailandica]|uniref:Acg family FMN-binding oxidoreductase n=1 Tax=Nocardia thailandica TaxID=257275 RepID=A0ABW6PXG3_9NOCA